MKNTPGNERIFWDSRARNYPLPFEAATLPKTSRILRLLSRQGVVFTGRDILDIGCGTGIYALTLAEKAGDIRLSVEDAGMGIPAEKLKAIYDPFYQVADYMTRKSGGLGLGLAVTKQITEACRGRIEVSSSVGKGTIFTLIFPQKENQCQV